MDLRRKNTTNPPPDHIQTHPEAGGDAEDINRLNYQTEFEPWTNPSSNSDAIFTDIAIILKQLNGSTIYGDLFKNSPPAAPKNLVMVNAGSNGQNPILQWDANTEPDLNHYAIYRGNQGLPTDPINWNSNLVATTGNTTWTDPFGNHQYFRSHRRTLPHHDRR